MNNPNDIKLQLNKSVTFETRFDENRFWLEDKKTDFWVMLPVDGEVELTYFSDDSSLMFAYPAQLSCVSIPTTIEIARWLADTLGVQLETS